MPIYEFRCTECHKTEEYFQKISDPAPEECAACGKKNTLEKVVSQSSFQLKGGGWYSDLYGSTKKSDSKGLSESTTATASTSATTTTSAPEPTPTQKTEPPSTT